jgi:SEC-C motif-containing protein
MRARYCAFATGRIDYVFATWHPATRPVDLRPAPEVRWVGLEVLGTVDGGVDQDTGTVEFTARFLASGRSQVMHETSRFQRRAGRWVYVGADIASPTTAMGERPTRGGAGGWSHDLGRQPEG